MQYKLKYRVEGLKKQRVLFLGMLCIFFISVAQDKLHKENDDDVRVKFEESFFEGLKQQALENYDKALEAFLTCKTIDTLSATVDFELSKCYKSLNRNDEAVFYGESAVKKDNLNPWYLKHLIPIYEDQGQIEKGISLLQKLDTINTAAHEELVLLYLRHRMKPRAKELLQQLKEKQMFSQKLARIEKKHFTPQKRIPRISGKNRSVDSIRYFLAKNNEAKAIAHFNRVLKDSILNNAIKKKALQSLLNALYTDKIQSSRLERATQDYVLLTKDYEMFYELARYFLNLKQADKAMHYYKLSGKQDNTSLAFFKKILSIKMDTKDYKQLYTYSKEALDWYPMQAELYLFKGISSYFLKKYDQAVNILESGIDFIVDAPEIKVEFYYYIAMAYEARHDKDNAQKNYLMASKLIAPRAMETATLAERYGDVLYGLKRFSEAVINWKKAIELGGSSSLINDKINRIKK